MQVIKHTYKDKVIRVRAETDYCAWRGRTMFTKEPETILWLEQMGPNDVLWDVGANIGLYSIFAAIVSEVGTVYAFEPDSQNFAELAQNININKADSIIPYCIGIGSKPDIGLLYLSDLDPGRSGHSISPTKNRKFVQGCVIESIDSLVEKGFKMPTHVKIDIDGLEPHVVMGMLSNIKSIHSILIELNNKFESHRALIEKIKSYGFWFDQEQVDRTSRPEGSGWENYHEYIFFNKEHYAT